MEYLGSLSICTEHTEFCDVVAKRINIKDPFPGGDQKGFAHAESSNHQS